MLRTTALGFGVLMGKLETHRFGDWRFPGGRCQMRPLMERDGRACFGGRLAPFSKLSLDRFGRATGFTWLHRGSEADCMNAPKQVLFLLLWLACAASVRALDTNAVQSAVRAVIEQQERDWNDGNIEKFMRGYLRSESTRFASGGNVTLGWQAVLERYQRTYGDKATMGGLTFSDLDISVVAEDGALAFGRWHLKREKDELSGLFTLLFRKTPDGWRIVHDHTSSAEKK